MKGNELSLKKKELGYVKERLSDYNFPKIKEGFQTLKLLPYLLKPLRREENIVKSKEGDEE